MTSAILSIILLACTPPTSGTTFGWAPHGWLVVDLPGTPHAALTPIRCQGEA